MADTITAERSAVRDHYAPKKSRALELFAELSRRPVPTPEQQSKVKNLVIGYVFGWDPLMRACDAVQRIGIFDLPHIDSHAAVSVAEDYFKIPPEICTFTKLKLGAHHLYDQEHGQAGRIVHFGGDCDPEVMAQELLRSEGYDVHVVEPLSLFKMDESRRADYVKFYVDEAQRLSQHLTGKPADEERVGEEIRKRNKVVAKLHEMMRLRLHNPYYVPIVQVNLINRLSSNRRIEKEFNEALDLLIEELKAIQNEPVPFHIPLVLVGVMHCEDLYEAIDQTVGTVVTGSNPLSYREDLPPLEALAEHVIEMQLEGHMHDKCGGVITRRRYRIERELEEWGAKGVIVGGTTNCPYLAIARELEYEYFSKKGVPLLVLDGTAENDPATEEQKMKLKAFIEMMI